MPFARDRLGRWHRRLLAIGDHRRRRTGDALVDRRITGRPHRDRHTIDGAKIGIVTVIVFAVICALIIFNTIQMAIFNRRSEIQIMRLLGASTNYIRGPFVVESAIYGLLSAVFSILIVNSVFLASSSALQASSLGLLDIHYANEYFGAHFWQLLLMQIAIGIIIGTVSSVIATRRYLKFKTK